MNPAYRRTDRLALPHVEIAQLLNANAFRRLVNFIDVDWTGIHISLPNVRSYLQRPDGLIEDIREAFEVQERMMNGDPKHAGYLKEVPPYMYWIFSGMVHPTEKAPYDRENSQSEYLTIVQNDMRTWRPIGATHYIQLEEHNRRLAASHGQMVALAKSINANIDRGVANGVKQAVKDSQMTLDQVYAEREKLERQQAEIEKRLKRLQEVEKVARERRPRSTAGYVYLIQSPTTYWKIGRTSDPNDRIKTFNVKLPFEVNYKHLIKTSDMYTLESNLHIKYASKRVEGEWFALTEDDVIEICNMKGDE